MTIVDSNSTILRNDWVNDEYKHMIVQVDQKAAQVKPGQFFNLLCPQTDLDKPFFRRPMSTYYADPTTHQVEFLYKVVGSGTRSLAALEPGQQLPVLGPLGNGFQLQPHYRHILIIGRGVGLATLAPLAEAAHAKQIQVSAILSARNKKSLMSQHRFTATGARLIEVVDSDGSSDIAHVRQLISQIHQNTPIDCLYTCGSSRIAKLLQELAQQFAIDGEVALEQQMACGIGMCYCCVKPFKVEGETELMSKRVCIDGPVFDIKELVL